VRHSVCSFEQEAQLTRDAGSEEQGEQHSGGYRQAGIQYAGTSHGTDLFVVLAQVGGDPSPTQYAVFDGNRRGALNHILALINNAAATRLAELPPAEFVAQVFTRVPWISVAENESVRVG
jgi:hypothetical protein